MLKRRKNFVEVRAEQWLDLRKAIKLIEMKVLRIEPDDVIVLQTDLCLDRDQVQALRKRAEQEFGASTLKRHNIVLLTAGLHAAVIRRGKKKQR